MNDLYYLTHLLFFDDVLIFLDGSQQDSSTFHDILKLFAMATDMEANHSKSTITLSYTSPQEAKITHHFFSVPTSSPRGWPQIPGVLAQAPLLLNYGLDLACN